MIEVIVDKLQLLNAVDTKLPFQLRKFNKVVSLALFLSYLKHNLATHDHQF